jgi:DNA-binding SARP family transcriptional activator/class 3 adenylate cyclase
VNARSAESLVAGGMSLPSGTVTLLFSDIEGSTGMLQRLRREYATLLADHHRLVDEAVRGAAGQIISIEGDGVYAVFVRAGDAVRAAVDVQRALANHVWPGGEQVRVRMGLHTGEPVVSGPRYVGLDVHRAARICAAAHGGQVVLSRLTASLVEDDLPQDVSLRVLGAAWLKDLAREEHLSQLVIEGLANDFPPLRVPQASADAGGVAPADVVRDAMDSHADSRVQVRLLGPVGASRDGADLRIGATKQRMVLATLALRVGETVSADVLIDVLWGERPPPTAHKALQVNISQLRKILDTGRGERNVIQTTPGGYRLDLAPDALDLTRFEQLWERARQDLAAAGHDVVETLRQALSLWRGDALSDLRYEQAFEADAARLEEMRLAAREDLIDAQLAAGEHAHLVSELERLVAAHPLRERLRGQLMLALYRSGRQADALSAFRAARDALIDQLGIDPSPALTELERRILNQDETLQAPVRGPQMAGLSAPTSRTLLVVSQSSSDLDGLLSIALPLAGESDELVLARMLTDLPGRDNSDRLRELTRRLAQRRDQLRADGANARIAAFSSAHPAVDLSKLATQQDAAVLLVDGARELLDGRAALAGELLDQAPCDVAFAISRGEPSSGEAILVPFGGSQDDWAALELAGRLAKQLRAPLVLAGSESLGNEGDASRLLATASLILQRLVGVTAEPRLITPGADGVLGAASDARLIVVGLSPRYRTEGLGETRHAIAKRAAAPSLFVRRGTRPGLLAPPSSLTRFRWSAVASRG